MKDSYISIKQIAEAKGLKSTRSLRLEINKPESKYISRDVKVNGGTSYKILFSSLEPELQQKLKYTIFNHRVLCSSIYSRENSCQSGTGFPTPFHPSDFWFFGLAKDLTEYFINSQLQTEAEASFWNFKYPTRCPYITPLWRFSPEQYFCVNWVKKYYPDLQFDDWSDWNPKNIEFSKNILYNNFVFLGYEESGIYSKNILGQKE